MLAANDTPDSPNRTVDPGQQTDIDPDDDPAEDPDDPANDPADDPGDDDPEPIVDEPDDPSGPKGKLELGVLYRFFEKKGKLVSLVMDGMTAKPELGMEIMHLLGVAVVDLFMLPAALIGQEEAALNSALSTWVVRTSNPQGKVMITLLNGRTAREAYSNSLLATTQPRKR